MTSPRGVLEVLKAAQLVFWDFDGVIKESVAIKAHAFEELFRPYGANVVARVKDYNERFSGVSRFIKLPIFLQFAGLEPSAERIMAMSDELTAIVERQVIEAPWVPGVELYLHVNARSQRFILVSATPQVELERIVQAVNLKECFQSVFGSPMGKREAIHRTMNEQSISVDEAVFIGDSAADLEAAQGAGIPFIMRRHKMNSSLAAGYVGPTLDDFIFTR
jgi:phosphoglycolate phosphatase-like HAD superfamily hydrolase